MPICSKCKIEKTIENFSFSNKIKGKYRKDCKNCASFSIKIHYSLNKESYREATRHQREKIKKLINKIKEQTPCVDCNKKYPYYVMDFDHKDRSLKENKISTMVNECSLERVLQEVKKCDVVCSNCHRIRTYVRKDYEKMPL